MIRFTYFNNNRHIFKSDVTQKQLKALIRKCIKKGYSYEIEKYEIIEKRIITISTIKFIPINYK